MPLPPIQIQLSKFEQLEILRSEVELRENELKQTEKAIREVLFEQERQKYLQAIHPIFAQLPQPTNATSLTQLLANREALGEALVAMQNALGVLESDAAGQIVPPSRNLGQGLPRAGAAPAAAAGAASGPRRVKFDSFDDFKANRAGPG